MLTGSGSSDKIGAIDVLFYLLVFLGSFIIAVSWLTPPEEKFISLIPNISVTQLLTAISFGFLILVVIGSRIKALSSLSISSPNWVTGAALSLPIWVIFGAFLPFRQASASVVTSGAGNFLVDIMGADLFNAVFNGFFFGTIEALILGFSLSILVGVGKTREGVGSKKKVSTIPIVILISGVLALAHATVAVTLAQAGALDFGTVLVHQFFAFIVMSFIFIGLGMAANIASHWVKNLMAFPEPVAIAFAIGFFILMFIICIYV